jgi:hypothetical protein
MAVVGVWSAPELGVTSLLIHQLRASAAVSLEAVPSCALRIPGGASAEEHHCSLQ